MGTHIIDGQFQSDKYPDTPRGLVPLKPTDPMAQDLLWEYAQRRRKVDEEFAKDLETVLLAAGYVPCPTCKGTGVEETGNNDLPCSCPAGARARFNVATPKGSQEMSGAEVRTHWTEQDRSIITAEEADTLRRAASVPDLQSGAFDEERDKRLYQPLLQRGLLRREIRPYPPDPSCEIVHYETTPEGLALLGRFDRANSSAP